MKPVTESFGVFRPKNKNKGDKGMEDTKDIIKKDLQIDALLHYLAHSVELFTTGYPAQTQIITRIENLIEMLEEDHNYPVEEFINISAVLRGKQNDRAS